MFLAAKIAASFIKDANSAPEKPTVLSAIICKLTSSANGFFLEWIFNIDNLPFLSGKSIVTFLSNLPGLKIAGSKISDLLVAAITITFSVFSNPSISTRIWFNVCSLSSFPPPVPFPLVLPIASISSIKIIEGEFSFAFLNKSLTREAPTPTNISTKSEPETE